MTTTRHDMKPASTATSARADALAEALDRLSGYAYTDGIGMATHGPMGAEAMSALGRDDLVVDWVESYKTRHDPIAAPPPVQRLDRDDTAALMAALGDPTRVTDWAAIFAAELAEQPWGAVLRRWLPQLLPGHGGAFTHGLLRTAHAVRALETIDPLPLLVSELAHGLGYWASVFKTLPGRPELSGNFQLAEAIARPPRPPQPWDLMGAGQFAYLDQLDGFQAAVEDLAQPHSLEHSLSDLTATYARLMLTHPDVHPFALIHAITPIAAARTLAPYLPDGSPGRLYAQLWHVNAAIAASFLPPTRSVAVDMELSPDTFDTDELAARAAANRDTHVIKFTEACLREHSLRPDPAYLAAAQQVLNTTPAW